ncbi:MAG: hypothetical protein V5A39_11465 [Haloarculaceae archaeon]
MILDQGSVQRGRELFVAGLSVRFDLQPTEASEVWDRELGAYFRERDGNTFRPAHRGYQRAVEAVVGEPVPVDEWLPLVTHTDGYTVVSIVDPAGGRNRSRAYSR